MATQKEIEYLLEHFDYNSFYLLGFYSADTKREDYDTQIARICKYFGIKNIFQYESIGIEDRKFVKPDLKTFSNN